MIIHRPKLRHRKRSRGQGLVEFALILPVFMLFLLIAVDFGRMLFTYIELNNTAREAASYAAFNPTALPAALKTAATAETNVQGQRGEGTITASSSCTDSGGAALPCANAHGGAGAGNRITVNVSETFTFFTPIVGGFWPGGLHIGASATAAVVDFAAGGGPLPASCSTVPATPVFTWQSPDPVNHPFLISVDANASPNQASPCQNVGYNWDFGGTSSDSPPNPDDPNREGITQDYEFATAGTYAVKLIVSNAAGDSPPYTLTISLGTTGCQAPTATFTISPALITDKHGNTNWTAADKHGNPGTQFNFDGTTSAFMSDPACHPVWLWDLGDTSTAATSTVLGHGYANAYANTTVNVKLTVKNDAGTNFIVQQIPLQ